MVVGFVDLQSETESRFLFILVIVDFSRLQIEAGVGAEQALANCWACYGWLARDSTCQASLSQRLQVEEEGPEGESRFCDKANSLSCEIVIFGYKCLIQGQSTCHKGKSGPVLWFSLHCTIKYKFFWGRFVVCWIWGLVVVVHLSVQYSGIFWDLIVCLCCLWQVLKSLPCNRHCFVANLHIGRFTFFLC